MTGILKLIGLLAQGKKHEARKKALYIYLKILTTYFKSRAITGVDVMSEKWDYLIILDACRYDFFEKMYKHYLKGDLHKKLSKGTTTSEWLRKSFDSVYDDTIYISANPHCSDHEVHGFKGTDHFSHIEHVWKYAWDNALDTVQPQEVSKAVLKMKEKYPEKKQIIHFIQPHGPWIGKTKLSAEELGIDTSHNSENGRWKIDSYVWELVLEGKFDIELLRQADIDNLELVLEEVKKLIEHLHGRIIITSDHGEAFGEKFVYGHPPGVYIKELTEVPWLIIEKEKAKKKIFQQDMDNQQTKNDSEKEILTQRLKALGYM